MGALAATGQALRKYSYEPLAPGFLHVEAPDPYRGMRGDETPEEYGRRCAEDLERKIELELPETVAAVIMEPIITGGGVLIPPDSYMPAIAEACKRHGVLLIVDEVICGFGRTGHMFGHDASGVRPDIVTMAKGITSGYIPLAATVVSDEVFSAFPAGPGPERLRHINTFGGHPAGCAVAVANIDLIEEEGLVERSAVVGEQLLARLRDAIGDHPRVGDMRGRGLLIGIEVVSDRASKQPDGPGAIKLAAVAQGKGLLLGRNADTAAGLDNVLAVAPPLNLTDEDVDHIVDVLQQTFEEVAV